MTPNIQQNVAPRRARASSGYNYRRRKTGITSRPWNSSGRTSRAQAYERGSVNNTTVSIGFGLIALIIVGLLGFFYLQQVVNTASQGTDVHQLESQIVELREQQRELELEGAQLRSLQAVGNQADKLNLVTTDRVSYLVPTDNRVAVVEE